jgi:hypothetical protein
MQPGPMATTLGPDHAWDDHMQTGGEIFLGEYGDGPGAHRLYAVLDELTLTYGIIERPAAGHSRLLRRHMTSPRDARAWADAYRGRDDRCRTARSQ